MSRALGPRLYFGWVVDPPTVGEYLWSARKDGHLRQMADTLEGLKELIRLQEGKGTSGE